MSSKPKKGRPAIWLRTGARQLMYEELVRQFGYGGDWEVPWVRPGNGRDKDYEKFLQSMAIVTGANSADAVKHQIAFGSPVRGKSEWSPSHTMSAVTNLAAALEAGSVRPWLAGIECISIN